MPTRPESSPIGRPPPSGEKDQPSERPPFRRGDHPHAKTYSSSLTGGRLDENSADRVVRVGALEGSSGGLPSVAGVLVRQRACPMWLWSTVLSIAPLSRQCQHLRTFVRARS